jgi:hypothetical protein
MFRMGDNINGMPSCYTTPPQEDKLIQGNPKNSMDKLLNTKLFIKIFNLLSDEDLLNVICVNKKWKIISIDIMIDRTFLPIKEFVSVLDKCLQEMYKDFFSSKDAFDEEKYERISYAARHISKHCLNSIKIEKLSDIEQITKSERNRIINILKYLKSKELDVIDELSDSYLQSVTAVVKNTAFYGFFDLARTLSYAAEYRKLGDNEMLSSCSISLAECKFFEYAIDIANQIRSDAYIPVFQKIAMCLAESKRFKDAFKIAQKLPLANYVDILKQVHKLKKKFEQGSKSSNIVCERDVVKSSTALCDNSA